MNIKKYVKPKNIASAMSKLYKGETYFQKIQDSGSKMAVEEIFFFNHILMYEFFLKILNFHATWYLGIFGVAEYESVFRFQKFKKAGPKWRTAHFKINRIRLKLVSRRCSGSLITNLYSDLKNSK